LAEHDPIGVHALANPANGFFTLWECGHERRIWAEQAAALACDWVAQRYVNNRTLSNLSSKCSADFGMPWLKSPSSRCR
jgi:hypothetical protein